MNELNRELENYLADLPGIGPRQARRIVYKLLKKEARFSRRLGELILNVRANMRLCQETFHYFYSEVPGVNLSAIATDETRDHTKILVVENDTDLENIETADTWRGTYFVLGGSLLPNMDPNQFESMIRLADFRRIISTKYADHQLSEVIFGLGSTVAGDFTTEILTAVVKEIDPNITTSCLGRGLSTGASLEYVDRATLQQALDHRG